MDLDDCLGLAELGRQPLGFSLESLVFGNQGGVGVGLPPTTFRCQAGQGPLVALLSPGGQVRRVETLAAQQGSELARLGRAIGLAGVGDIPYPFLPRERSNVNRRLNG